ncbi:MAG: Flp pilus assembly protein CpaB [Dehalococcoidia bacterium]|nr:Flp pilus assembly protein CpaB [Dehalococcoidia bacterium]
MARIEQLKLAGSNRALLLLALIAGLVAAVVVFIAVSNGGDDNANPAGVSDNVTSALIATQSISVGTEITSDMVKIVSVPNDLLVSGAYADSELVVGDVARVAIAQGEQITSNKVGIAVPDKGLSGVLPLGMRAIGVNVEQVTAVGGLLLPGDHVDIVATYKIKRAPGLAEDEYILRTETILQNVEILSVGQEAQEASARIDTSADPSTTNPSYTSGDLPDNVEEQPRANTITVALSLADAQLLISFQQRADQVWAAERAFGETARAEIPPHEVILVE